MKAEQIKKLIKGKSKVITLRINPALLEMFDKEIAKDKDYESRNELIESLILRYLEEKGKL